MGLIKRSARYELKILDLLVLEPLETRRYMHHQLKLFKNCPVSELSDT
jgi:hypothetical protein